MRPVDLDRVSVESSPGVEATVTLASRFRRLIGQGIDAVIGFTPLVFAAIRVGSGSSSSVWGASFIIAGIAWVGFYHFFADALNEGQSVGKLWLGMRVIDARTGAPCTYYQSFVRNLLLSIAGPLDWIFIFGERRQRLGDALAGTIVVEAS
jgi:uncharacterized RDD family membrane protein YckC